MAFVGDLVLPPKPILRPRPVPKLIDVPGTQNITVGHIARLTSTDYYTKMLQYKQRKKEYEERSLIARQQIVARNNWDINTTIHMERKGLSTKHRLKFQEKVRNYDEEIQKRREKLTDLFWAEQREFMKEAIDVAVKKQAAIEEYKKQAAQIPIKKREEDRIKVAQEAKLQQIIKNTDMFTPILYQKRLLESKEAQRLQIKDNEAKRELEREEELFWNQMSAKRMEAENEVDYQKKLKKLQRIFQCKEHWAIQLKEKAIKEQLIAQEKLDDFNRIHQLELDLVREKKEAMEEKHRKFLAQQQDLQDQLSLRNRILKQREDEERTLREEFAKMEQREVEKERREAEISKEKNKDETYRFYEYQQMIKKEEAEAQRKYEECIEQTRKEVDQKYVDARCKWEAERAALEKGSREGIVEQMRLRKEREERERKLKEEEVQMLNYCRKQHNKLRQLQVEKKKQAKFEYRDQLQQQLDYNKRLRDMEKAEEKRQLAIALAEEEEYNNVLDGLTKGTIKYGQTHHFHAVVENKTHICPYLKIAPLK